uniref:Uncharacterized protein n=1 Tax=Nelumbo nucifera TaxID=4432 RepID=A0A822Z3G9_NELNU|nr:TPA_asm: hypothetical protein HUJ06_013533 [Nelumbo nucifera]
MHSEATQNTLISWYSALVLFIFVFLSSIKEGSFAWEFVKGNQLSADNVMRCTSLEKARPSISSATSVGILFFQTLLKNIHILTNSSG